MKKLLGLSLMVVVGIIGYTHFLRVQPASADESALGELERRFQAVTESMALASRSAGATGIDTTADIESARAAMRRLESDLKSLRDHLSSDAARRRADLLQEKIQVFRESME